MRQNNLHNFTNKRNHILARNKKNRNKNVLSESSFAHFQNFNSFYLQEEHNVQLAKEVLAVESRIETEEEEYESFRPPNIEQKVSKSNDDAVLDFIASQNINKNCQFSGGSVNNGTFYGKNGQNGQKRSISSQIKKCQQSSNSRDKGYESQNKKQKVLKRRENNSLMILNKKYVRKDIITGSQLKKHEISKQKTYQKQTKPVSLKVLKESKKSSFKFNPQCFSQNYLNMSFTPDVNFLRGKMQSKRSIFINHYEKIRQKERRSFSQTQSLTNKRNSSFSNQEEKTDNQQLHFKDNHMKKPNVLKGQQVQSKNLMRTFMVANNAIFEQSIAVRDSANNPSKCLVEFAISNIKESKQKQELIDINILAVEKLKRQIKQIKVRKVPNPILHQRIKPPEPIKL